MENKKNNEENFNSYDFEEKKRKQLNDKIFYYGSFIIFLLGIIIYYLTEKYFISYIELIPSNKIIKSISDKNNYKLIKLHTGLEILIIQNTKSKSSSCSLSVDAGSIYDITLGMAHFCEHMLFLGNKKYPSEKIFSDNLEKYNGKYNAFTMKDKTIYFFEINNDGFISQLELFASMFDKPLFNKNFVNKEINAINSEHEKNKINDYFITDFLIKTETNKKSHFKKFECGDNSTLININDNLRQELIDYFENFYTNDNMKLVISSNYTIDEILKLIENNFISGYVGKQKKLKSNNKLTNKYKKIIKQLKEEPIYSHEKDFSKLIYYKSYDGKNKLNLYFILNSIYENLNKEINPHLYFKYMFNYKGDNSLINILRENGFIINLKIEEEENNEYYYLYKISCLLTDKGVNNYKLVIKLIFGYINFIKLEGIKEKTFIELNKILKLNFNFKQQKQLFKKVINLSLNLFSIKNKTNILFGEKIINHYNEKILYDFIDSISIDNCLIVLSINKEQLDNDTKSNFQKKLLPFYNLKYFVTLINENILGELKYINKINLDEYETLKNIKILKNQKKFYYIKDIFELRKKNNFITNYNNIINPCYFNYKNLSKFDSSFCPNGEFIPNKILDEIKQKYPNYKLDNYKPIEIKNDLNNRLEFWYKIDNSFNLPKENIIIKIKSKIFLENKNNYLMLLLLKNYIEIKILKQLYEAIDSYNLFSINIKLDSLILKINCFSDLDNKIIQNINKILFNDLNLNNEINIKSLNNIFDIIKNNAINEIKTYKSELAYTKTFKKLTKLIIKNITLKEEYSDEDIKNISIDNFKQFILKFNENYFMTVLIHGNTNITKINKIYNLINSNLQNNKKIINKKILEQNELKDNTFFNFYYINPYKGETNHVTMINYQMRFPEKNQNFMKIDIYNLLYKQCIGNLFFTKLRTEMQLGYIVGDKFSNFNKDTFYLSIIVQGTKKYPEEIDDEINSILKESININCNENFEELKNSLIYKITANENNLDERSEFFENNIFNMKYNFDEKLKNVEIIKNIKDYDEIIKYIKFNFIENPRRIGIYNYANNMKEIDVKKRIEIKNQKTKKEYQNIYKIIYSNNENDLILYTYN